MMKSEIITILGGPSREDLFDCLRLNDEQRSVLFDLGSEHYLLSFHSKVCGISICNEGDDLWNIKINVSTETLYELKLPEEFRDKLVDLEGYTSLCFCYSTKKRTGTLIP